MVTTPRPFPRAIGLASSIRVLAWVLLAALAAVVVFFGVIIAASESGEVVTLTTREGERTVSTRLWIVDYEGAEWVRTGSAEKGWYRRVLADPVVRLERGDASSTRIAVPARDPEVASRVNSVFAEKYGIANEIVALSGDARKRVPVRLDPAQ